MSLRNIIVQYVGDTLYLPPLEREVNHIIVSEYDVKDWEHFEPVRTCKLIRHGSLANMPSFICWSCSECGFGWHHSENDKQFSYCPNCGARVVD